MEKLTNLEEMIMKCIWDYGEEIPFLQIGKELKERYGKEYKRTSIRTYLFRLEDKEYLKVDKRGRNAYVYPIISEKEYRKEKAEDILDNWFDGSAKELFTALSEKIPKSEKERLKGVLDDMDLYKNMLMLFSAVLLNFILGTIIYIIWKLLGRLAESKGYVEINYWIWKIVLLAFLCPVGIIVLFGIKKKGLYGFDFWYANKIRILLTVLGIVWFIGSVIRAFIYMKRCIRCIKCYRKEENVSLRSSRKNSRFVVN